jgi:hypothetical protein
LGTAVEVGNTLNNIAVIYANLGEKAEGAGITTTKGAAADTKRRQYAARGCYA